MSNKRTIFTAAMRNEFLKELSRQDAAPPPAWQKYTLVVPSDQRIEEYPWFAPIPHVKRYLGHRRYANLDYTTYQVPNIEYDNGIKVRTRDIEDDKTGGYELKFADLAREITNFPGREVAKALRDGTSTLCFDGSNFFANSHTIGTGDNLLTFTASGTSDAATYKAVFMFTGNRLKPVLWQDRKKPDSADALMTNALESSASEEKEVRYWTDIEGAVAYGLWWDAVHVTITNTPDVSDMFDLHREVLTAMRGFKLPKADEADDDMWPHQELNPNSENFCVVASTGLVEVFNALYGSEQVGYRVSGGSTAYHQTNIYRNGASVVGSGYLD